ncbi:thiopeptide-type bacteriocin biosynthesis protein [Streptomyces sp. NPDC006333]|uniref:thiopeptide-type bacteriocin biosynthesis protein n=1 Tax=Streptomyces sp. NPDC006333 TaxID=3156753 RepID=UPI0033B937B4
MNRPPLPIGPGTTDEEDTLIPPHQATHHDNWVDIGLALTGYPPSTEVYERLLDETQRLRQTGLADLFLFIHKPPGLRWRLQAADGTHLGELRREAVTAAARIVGRDHVRSAVYEPQQTLFGGARSMGYVHRTWSADSLLWMRWHAGARPGSRTAGERLILSFRALAHVFVKLGVVGWEDREVWNHVTEETGRRLAEHEWARPEVVALARSLRVRWDTVWAAPHDRPGLDQADQSPLLHTFARTSGPTLEAWHAECLSRPATRYPLTPRRAAAYWTVFHWNRAGLTAAQQALTAQTLAGRPLDHTYRPQPESEL